MTGTQLLSADLSDPGGSVPLRGFLDRCDPAFGFRGWAVDLSRPESNLLVELWADTAVVARTLANLRRDDIARLGSAKPDVGFRFDPGELRSKLVGRGLAADARLWIRIADTDFALRSATPVPPAAAFMHPAQDGPATGRAAGPVEDGTPAPDRTEEPAEDLPPADVGRDLPSALRTMSAQAANLPRPAVAGGAVAGHIECLSWEGEDDLVWVLGWMKSHLPLHAPATIFAGGVAHPSALAVATYVRSDLPDDALGILGVLRTGWRFGEGGGPVRLVFGGTAAGARLNLLEKPRISTARGRAGWFEERKHALRGPFVDPLLQLLGPTAADAAPPPAAKAPDEFGALMKRGAEQRAAGDHVAALELFEAAIALRPREAWARMAAAEALRGLGRQDGADERCRAVLADEPGHTGALMSLGHSLRRRGDAAGALPLFQAALERKPREAWARMAVADTLADLGRADEAEEACRAVLADEPEHVGALMSLGHSLRRRGDAAAALTLFRAALALRPGETGARMAVADTLADLGHDDEAEEACRTVLAGEPEHVGALMSLGHSLRRRGDAAGALPHFEAALGLRPRESWARMAVADTLADLHRLDEAEAACRAVLADEPEHVGALMSLGHVANARADRAAAASWFERAARAAPDAAAGARLALAAALRDLGDFDAAAAAAQAVLARNPGEAEAWMSLGHTERRAGRREAALEAFARASELKPGSPGPLAQMAVEERRLGRPEACERLLNRALEADAADAETLLQFGEHFRLAGALGRALGMFRRAMALPRPIAWAWLAASQVLVDTGGLEAAFRTLEDAEARFGPKPEIAAKRVELLRRTGDWAAACDAADRAAAAWPHHFGVWFERAHVERLRGGQEAHAACLREAPAGNTHDRARVFLLEGLLAAERWRFDEAEELYKRSIELNSDDGWPRICLAQARLLMLDTEGAREQLRAVSRMDLSAAKLQGRSANISQTHLGQLLDEFTLDEQALAELRAVRGLAPDERVESLLALVRRYPEYTPAAVGLLTALRQSGRLARRPSTPPPRAAARAASIPRSFAQYWDDSGVPADLERIMRSWGRLYPGFGLRRFSDEQARAFLARSHSAEVQAAYRRSRQPAQKADIFRLAYLYSEGGYYADADDRLVGDFEALRFPGARLLLYQEDFGTVGNNLIGAVPGHPLIGRALRLAVEAINRGDNDILWLSTGPGLLTRAFACLLADPGREPLAALDDAVVLEHGELGRVVSIHCLVGYKNTERHWSRTAFGRRGATNAAAPPPPRAPARETTPAHGAEAGRAAAACIAD